MMLYQKDHHQMPNDRVESAFALVNYSSNCYSPPSTPVLRANVYFPLAYAGHYTKCFTCIYLQSWNNKYIILLFLFYKWGSWDVERLSNLLSIITTN